MLALVLPPLAYLVGSVSSAGTGMMKSPSDNKTVFLSGSRRLPKLDSVIEKKLHNIIEQNYAVLVGDANGADKAFQQFFSDHHYANVTVYCMDMSGRNNVGGWNECKIDSNGRTKKDAKYFALKDAEMAKQADYGLMLWDGKSKGTFNNIVNMQAQEKKSWVYFAPEHHFIPVKSADDIKALVEKCDGELAAYFETQIKRLVKSQSSQSLQTSFIPDTPPSPQVADSNI